jgi:hypothetical protein
LVPVHKRPGLKAGAFSRALLVPVAETGINGLDKPGLKAFFPPVGGRCSALGWEVGGAFPLVRWYSALRWAVDGALRSFGRCSLRCPYMGGG